ncbi:hypothetical protein [Tenacibaculum sp. SDUM215027]|uniref:hypothetical protein n=1 Tax=Tenacibaculum sp. SDUM215027 TaxID=3422596 RepID=UPI003D315AAE
MSLGKVLSKVDQKQINGGNNCDSYKEHGLCFGPVPGCLSCDQIECYPSAIECALIHSYCFEEMEPL